LGSRQGIKRCLSNFFKLLPLIFIYGGNIPKKAMIFVNFGTKRTPLISGKISLILQGMIFQELLAKNT
jgi:hypothetical protein